MININKLKLTQLQQNILDTLFVKVGNYQSQRDLSKILNVSPPAVKKAIPKLIENNLIKMNLNKSKITQIELNFDNPPILNLKRIFNLNSIYSSELLKFLEQNLPGATIILFGSYSKGEDTINSDIDIAIIGRKEKNLTQEQLGKLVGVQKAQISRTK